MSYEALWQVAAHELHRMRGRTFELEGRVIQNFDLLEHTKRVLGYSKVLVDYLGVGDDRIILPAAILHDIGIPASVEKYGNADPENQGREGAALAARVLAAQGTSPRYLRTILDIVAAHHEQIERPSPEFQIVHDADFLVHRYLGNAIEPEEFIDLLYTEPAREIARRQKR